MTKDVELFLGRFQPFHNGHASVVAKMKNPVVAIVKGGATSEDKSKNPLSVKDQARLLKKAFPGTKIIIVANGYVPDIGLELRTKGLELKAVYGGSDREAAYTRQLKSFDQKNPDKAFKATFKNTFTGGSRVGGTSATIVRKAIRDNDFSEFKKHMPKALHSEWEFLRRKIR